MTVTFEQLQKANESIRTLTISRQNKKTGEVASKEYAEVNQRVKAFRMVYPKGRIITEMISNQDGVCVFRATICDEDGTVLATGTAFEKQSSSMINQTSFIENCETSAVGRALGLSGFGIDTSIASYEEVKNAQAQQDASETAKPTAKDEPQKIIYATEQQKKLVRTLIDGSIPEKVQVWISETFGITGIESIDKMTVAQASNLIKSAEAQVVEWWKNAKPESQENMLRAFGINRIDDLSPVDRMNAAKAILGIK